MTDNPTGPEYVQAVDTCLHAWDEFDLGDPRRTEILAEAQVNATMAQNAILLMIAETMRDSPPYEMERWREVIPLPPLKKCKGKEIRRPECAKRHTEDCMYTDPVPEPEHVLLSVGTRVLVSETHRNGCSCPSAQPYVGRIAGYDMHHSKYQINEERYGTPGEYYDFVKWVFADNRVQVHPDGSAYRPVSQEPTGPRIYVEHRHGKQGHIVDVTSMNGSLMFLVQWHVPGTRPVSKAADTVTIIPADHVQRCPNGQTGDECGSGENQCEPCLQAEDEEGDMIEESMGLR